MKEEKGKRIVERIYERAEELGISGHELARRVNKAPNTFANWTARNTIPPADTALALADELDCSIRWLITGVNDNKEGYSLEEKNLINKFRRLDTQGQFEIKTLLEAKLTPVKNESVPEVSAATEKKRNIG